MVPAGSDEDLDGNVVDTRIEVAYEAGLDFFRGAVKDQRVNEPVASITGHILGCETVAEKVVDIVTQLEVWPRDERASDSASSLGIGADHNRVLGRQQGLGTQDFAS